MRIPFLSKISRSRASPASSLFGSAYRFFFGTTSGKAVNELTAMQTTAVYACVRILAEAIAGLPENVTTIVMVGRNGKPGERDQQQDMF